MCCFNDCKFSLVHLNVFNFIIRGTAGYLFDRAINQLLGILSKTYRYDNPYKSYTTEHLFLSLKKSIPLFIWC